MKVRDRILTIADLFLGALYADARYLDTEKAAVRRMLRELIVREQLPAELEERIERFDPKSFDLDAVAADFQRDPPMQRRRLLELVAKLCVSDGELDLAEDDYLRRLAQALRMDPTEYEDLVLDYQISELRQTFEMLRVPDALKGNGTSA